MKRLILLSLLLAATVAAQNPATPLPTTATNPNGQACQANTVLNYVPSGVIYTCQNGTMAVATGGAALLNIGTTTGTVAAGNDSRFPASVTGIRKSAGSGSTDTAAAAADVGALVGIANPSDTNVVNYIGTDGTQHRIAQSGGMVYPGSGIPTSTGSAWGSSYTVGTAANNLVQLNGSAQLPAVSAALLTNWPTFNQNTSGTAGGLTSQYVDWSAASGGASIANKPTLGTASSHAATDFEPALGNPSVSGYVLSSTTLGVRSWIANGSGGSGSFVTLSGDAASQANGGATVVNGLKGVPFCTGYTPTEGQFVEWTALSTPNPCYTAAAGGGGLGSLTAAVVKATSGTASAAAAADVYGLWSGTKDASHCMAGDGTMRACAGGGGSAPYSCAISVTTTPFTETCTHSLNTTSPLYQCWNSSGGYISAGATITDANNLTLSFSGAITGTCIISTGGSGPMGSTGPAGPTGPSGPPANLPVPSTTCSLSAPGGVCVCTGSCTVTLFAPTMAGDQVCVLNDTGVSTGITISGIAGVFFSKTDRTAYGSSAGSFVGTAASGLEACFIARDTTHWVVTNAIGTWTAN